MQTQLNNSELKPHKFAPMSIDNIDILQPYGFVSCLNATRSGQRPSVQCVQPLPLTGNLTRYDISSTNITTNKRPPVNTPVPREECKRRQRTLTEQHSPHSVLLQNPVAEEPTPVGGDMTLCESTEYHY